MDNIVKLLNVAPSPATMGYPGQYWEFTARRELRIPRCLACQHRRSVPFPFCNRCLSTDSEWEVVPPIGTLWTWCTFDRWYYAGESATPYSSGEIRIDELDCRLTGQLLAGPSEDLAVGVPMSCEFVTVGDFTVPVWRVEPV